MTGTSDPYSKQLNHTKIALVIGATGATGKPLVNQLLADAEFSEVHIFVRNKIEISNPKLKMHIVDFEKMEQWKELIKGDVSFSCMGTTLKQAGSKAAQKKIDFDYQNNFAKYSKENGVPHFVLVSAYGASSNSSIFYSRIKGELEDSIKQLQFTQCSIFQPGMLDRQNTDRKMEVWGVKILNFITSLGIFKSQKPLPTQILAKAMIQASKSNFSGFRIYALAEIFKLANEK